MVVFGYPTEQQRHRPKPARADLRHIVHENGYRDMGPEALRDMFSARSGRTPYEDWMRAFCKRKFDSDFAREMNRSARVYLEDFEGDEG